MLDREQQLIAAAIRYTTTLAGPSPVSIRDFVATVDPDLRDELAAHLELYLVTPQPTESIIPTAEEQALIDRATTRAQARWQQWIVASVAPAPTLSGLRKARSLTPSALARQINLPVDLWQRIERGGVLPATLPAKLIQRLGAVLQQAEATVQAALAAPPMSAAVQWSAQDATTTMPENAVSFAEALAASTATDAEKMEWA